MSSRHSCPKICFHLQSQTSPATLSDDVVQRHAAGIYNSRYRYIGRVHKYPAHLPFTFSLKAHTLFVRLYSASSTAMTFERLLKSKRQTIIVLRNCHLLYLPAKMHKCTDPKDLWYAGLFLHHLKFSGKNSLLAYWL